MLDAIDEHESSSVLELALLHQVVEQLLVLAPGALGRATLLEARWPEDEVRNALDAFADIGRVFVEGERSSDWHPSGGGKELPKR